MRYRVTVLPDNRFFMAQEGANLLEILRANGYAPDAPCGGKGSCGKCTVLVDNREALACQTVLTRDMSVTVRQGGSLRILRTGVNPPVRMNPVREGYLLAFDIGTTSVVCFLLDGKTGVELASASMLNPQTAFGADVISRIQAALEGAKEEETGAIRRGMTQLTEQVCAQAGISPEVISVVSVVGNPAMQQLFMGLLPDNLARVPFAPVLTRAETVSCADYLPICANALLLVIPDISGYVGADTMGCILSTGLHEDPGITLMVDIGTNGELVLGGQSGMIACSTAAGPALEGANIRFGMRGTEGAVDHVWAENGAFRCSVIGGGSPRGICGSGLIDAVAVSLELGLLNKRGRIQGSLERDGQRIIPLTEDLYLTQEDIRQVQLAKGAIRAGIQLMASKLGIGVGDIQRVLLAGAFGTFLNPASACRIGLLPEELGDRITAVGNAAGSGAKQLACDAEAMERCRELTGRIEFLELASLPQFPGTFARAMAFREGKTGV